MQYRQLGNSSLNVSALCLGTMTWGEQNTEAEAHEQLDYAFGQGINFIDTAEMYPVPARPETQGRTETIIGSWLQQRGCRDKIVLATKVAGPGRDWLTHIRGGNNCLDRANIENAVNESLRRLQTDYIDFYQIHWPDRQTNFFGKLGYPWPEEDDSIPIAETLGVLDELIRRGKIRHVGVSNETPWGVMRYLCLAENQGWSRIQGVQNPYNLLNRSYEIGLAEISHREQVGLLAYSPLGFGVLSGKYLQNPQPPGARLTLFPEYSRYSNPQAQAATTEYVALAQQHSLDPAQMALAFVTGRPFVTSNIIGATTMEQLRNNIASAELQLSGNVLEGIEEIHARHSNPAP
ncbi:MAG TPA: NADP(H)-dependent aldo-keto reductase [Chromatiaceae bacterium]|nr:NADP(H)-dependent aldo-keto reductase [Chromatiaceae bacterium]